MATILLSAAGLAIGGSIGGSVLGLSTAVIGRAVGATLGRTIDNRLLGRGARSTGAGRVERFRLMGAGEGDALGVVHGRMRVGGQVIWASRFLETAQARRGSKGSAQPQGYGYSVSLAVALCEGEITHLGRIWADGVEIDPQTLSLSLYKGDEAQMPDPRIEAVEGAGAVPAYRGIAYVVIEDLDLTRFGNRVPQFNFEVVRAGAPVPDGIHDDLTAHVRAVALIPGSGEYALATTPVYLTPRFAEAVPVNLGAGATGRTDLDLSLDALRGELPRVGSVSLVVSWFGDDLRASHCNVRPLVEQKATDATAMPWRAGGIARAEAALVPHDQGAPVYGGTPADAAVVEAIAAIHARGQEAMFYPFVLMTQLGGNDLPDPWSGDVGQPALPWRGRITLDAAPGRAGSTDGTAIARAEVAAFFGQAAADDFSVSGTTVSYHGPAEWSYRRFILHYAHLCAAAGGVEAFCIGSELVSLTQVRDDQGYPAVAQLVSLARDLRAILGAGCKIGYAADWTEYHGHQPAGTADKIFHLDPLWADAAIDFVGIDNYMPIADWREGEAHADAAAGSIYNLDYLRGNVAGGEGYDWYYHSPEARAAQIRTPITDGLAEPWLWRVKDIAGWWGNAHHDRVNGIRATNPTGWVPQSKPVWFTELGCAAIHLGANEPNKFLDPKSSESALPYGSNGLRDDLMQQQYLRAVLGYYADPAHNPVSAISGMPMVDLDHAHVWAWDARPWPAFPLRRDLWSDGDNHDRGHWLNGRAGARTLAGVVAEICDRAGVAAYDVSRVFGVVRGYAHAFDTGRAALEPLMLTYGFDVAERDGMLVFTTRGLGHAQRLDPARLAVDAEAESVLTLTREALALVAGRVRLGFADADADYAASVTETVHPDDPADTVAAREMPLALSRAEARQIVDRWMAEARVARSSAAFALPPSTRALGAGDVVSLNLPDGAASYRIDRIEEAGLRRAEATRIEPEVYHRAPEIAAPAAAPATFAPPVPVAGLFLDLPLVRGDEAPHAPHAALVARPWPGPVALYASASDADYALDSTHDAAATIGLTETPLAAAPAGQWDRASRLRVRLSAGTLTAATPTQVLAGANLAAIGDGTADGWEIIQFADAELVAPDTWEIGTLLRGQAGSDGIMPDLWPAESYFVLLDQRVTQIAQPVAARGVMRHLRWGPAARPLGDPTYRHAAHAFAGNGLRPYAVAHLAAHAAGADTELRWMRRTRTGGDDWTAPEVPLGEEAEAYLLRVFAGGSLRREYFLNAPQWTYPAADRGIDTVLGALAVEVAQLSASFGAGPFRRLAL